MRLFDNRGFRLFHQFFANNGRVKNLRHFFQRFFQIFAAGRIGCHRSAKNGNNAFNLQQQRFFKQSRNAFGRFIHMTDVNTKTYTVVF